jgi:hypothetical protein
MTRQSHEGSGQCREGGNQRHLERRRVEHHDRHERQRDHRDGGTQIADRSGEPQPRKVAVILQESRRRDFHQGGGAHSATA